MVTTLAWALTLAAVIGLLALDVLVAGRRAGAVQFRAAVSWSVFYIAAALAFGVIFIALGAALLDAFSFMFVIFGLLLLGTAVQLLRHRHKAPSVRDNALLAAARRVLPVTDRYDQAHLTTRIHGRRSATPMLMVLIAIGTTDALFALDSIPAVFGVTQQPYIVFCANAFALLGLRAMFFLVSGLLERLTYLSLGLT